MKVDSVPRRRARVVIDVVREAPVAAHRGPVAAVHAVMPATATAATAADAGLLCQRDEVEVRRPTLETADTVRVDPIAALHDRLLHDAHQREDVELVQLTPVDEHAGHVARTAARRVGTQWSAEAHAGGDDA